jgi:hypothetical protein
MGRIGGSPGSILISMFMESDIFARGGFFARGLALWMVWVFGWRADGFHAWSCYRCAGLSYIFYFY